MKVIYAHSSTCFIMKNKNTSHKIVISPECRISFLKETHQITSKGFSYPDKEHNVHNCLVFLLEERLQLLIHIFCVTSPTLTSHTLYEIFCYGYWDINVNSSVFCTKVFIST